MIETTHSKPEGYLTINEFAEKVNRTSTAIYAALKAGKIPSKLLLDYQPLTGRRAVLISVDALRVMDGETRGRKKKIELEKIKPPVEDVEHIGDIKIQKEKLLIEQKTLELQKAKNEVITASRVEEVMTNMGIMIKQSLLSFISRVAPLMAAEDNVVEIIKILEKEIKYTLDNIVDINALVKRK